MRRTFGLVLAAVLLPCLHTQAIAQGGSWVVTVPSPTAASLGKFGDVPVGLYTGLPDISIPLFTVKGKTLELPLTLSYHASGLKVDDIGGWVGMGWALSAGGTITRSVRGLPDEWTYGYYNTGTALYDGQNWPIPSGVLLQNIQLNYVDGEPDQFFVNLAGRSAEFVMGPTSSTGSQMIRTIPYQDWVITPTITGGMVSQWLVITEDGTRYTFGAVETSRDLSGWGPLSVTAYASSWQLTGIQAPGGDNISLYYTSYLARHNVGTAGEQRLEQTAQCPPGGGFGATQTQEVTTQRLDSIVSAAHTISFSTTLRTDALNPVGGTQQEPRLDLITVKTPAPGNVVLRKFQLAYDYSIGNPGRLTLKNVYEQDRNGVSLPPHTLSYNTATTLPATGSAAQDHWGYYNGATGNSSLLPGGKSTMSGVYYPGANRHPYSTFMQAGVLTRMTYPTGGYNDLIYEANDYGVAFAGGTMTDSGPPQLKAVGSNSTIPGVRQTPFTVGGIATVPVMVSVFVSFPPPGCSPNCPYAKITGAANYGPWYQSTSTTVGLAPGNYVLEASEAGYGTSVALSVSWSDYVTVTTKMGGGLRIAEIQTADGMGNVSIRKYKYTLQDDPTRSSGMIYSEPDYDYEFHGYVHPEYPAPGPWCDFYSRSYMPAMFLGGGSPVVYEEVTVWEGANAEFGRTRHRFYLHDQAPIVNGSWPFHRRTSHFWRWGQEILSEDYDSSNRLQRSVATAYTFPTPTETTKEFHGLSMNTWPSNAGWTWNTFTVQAMWKHPTSETTTVYDTTGTASYATTKTFTYSNPTHGQITELIETNSDGAQRVTRYRYPGDYATGGTDPEAAALDAMQQDGLHIHNAVIERTVVQRIGATEKVVESEVTTYKAVSGKYLPYQRFVLNSPSPIP